MTNQAWSHLERSVTFAYFFCFSCLFLLDSLSKETHAHMRSVDPGQAFEYELLNTQFHIPPNTRLSLLSLNMFNEIGFAAPMCKKIQLNTIKYYKLQ